MLHSIICIGSHSDEEEFESINIWCETCDELLFYIEAPTEPETPAEPGDQGNAEVPGPSPGGH